MQVHCFYLAGNLRKSERQQSVCQEIEKKYKFDSLESRCILQHYLCPRLISFNNLTLSQVEEVKGITDILIALAFNVCPSISIRRGIKNSNRLPPPTLSAKFLRR